MPPKKGKKGKGKGKDKKKDDKAGEGDGSGGDSTDKETILQQEYVMLFFLLQTHEHLITCIPGCLHINALTNCPHELHTHTHTHIDTIIHIEFTIFFSVHTSPFVLCFMVKGS